MAKKLNNLKWESVALDGFPESMSDNFHGFVGLEECTDYKLDNEKKRNKKKKKPEKRKENASSLISNTEVPAKKIKLSNGFMVESCEAVRPSLNCENTEDVYKGIETNKNEENLVDQKHSKGSKKNKIKLGENLTNVLSTLSMQDMAAWSSFQIPDEILKALAEQGFEKPTKIQELTLPAAMLGRRDILGAAETGSGKTLAFGIPILAGIMKLKEKHAAGIDVYNVPYKKSSVKKKREEIQKESKPKRKKSLKKKVSKNKAESSEEGYSSGSNNDSDDESEDKSQDNSETEDKSDDDYLEEYDVPIKKKENTTDEGNDSDENEEYVHLSEMHDSDDLADSSSEENDDVDDGQQLESSGEETDSQNEYEGGSENDEQANETGDGIGCVKVIDDVELPGHVVTKTGKPLYALILTPTRELAIQISRHLIAAAKYTGVRVATVVGGMASVKQERVLSKGPEIVVATPGRLWELMRQGEPHLQQVDNIKFLAIDETDRMVERNHFEELHPLLERLNLDEDRRTSRQNFVFSATLTMVHDLPTHMKGKKVTKRGKIIHRKIQKMTPEQKVKKLVTMIGMTDPKVVDITKENLGTAETLTECRITCSLEQKDHYLYYILKIHPGRTIVFCNSIGSVKRLAQLFGILQCSPLPLHASMPQRQRLKNLERFRDNPHGVLVATDVAARGLDIPDVDHVVHYQVPRTAENYVHRSGRTARANKEGLTILMIEPGEAFLYSKLCRTLNKKSELPSFPVPSHVLNSMKDIVTVARELDKLQLSHRRGAQEQGWLDKAAKDMDMLIDEDFVPIKYKDNDVSRALQAKKKQLENLLSKPIFPKGFSYKYPTLNDPELFTVKTDQNALDVMKKAIKSGALKKEKRKSKNDSLLKLGKKLRNKK